MSLFFTFNRFFRHEQQPQPPTEAKANPEQAGAVLGCRAVARALKTPCQHVDFKMFGVHRLDNSSTRTCSFSFSLVNTLNGVIFSVYTLKQ